MKKIKIILFYAGAFLFLLLSFEICAHIIYRITKGVFIWEVFKQSEVFNIRPFTEIVNDDRLVTIKKNFSCVVTESSFYSVAPRDQHTKRWPIITDDNGFRVGKNKYFRNKPNVIFLGDSVPFGWGMEGDKNVPSFFYELLVGDNKQDIGVINAAIPSYSLYQSVERYKIEINGKFGVKMCILQVYDPANQFVMHGRSWDKKINWVSKDTLVSTVDVGMFILKDGHKFMQSVSQYSALCHGMYVLYQHFKKRQPIVSKLELNDQIAFSHFEQENVSVLEELYTMLKHESIPLVLIPINPTKPRYLLSQEEFIQKDSYNQKLLVVIDTFNDMLRKFADTHSNVYYFDIAAFDDEIGRNGLFLDQCCHLSEKGAKEQAGYIYSLAKKKGLL